MVGVKDGSVTGKLGVGVAGPFCASQAEISKPITKINLKRDVLSIIGFSASNITRSYQ
jgi:hypothetical protein